MAKCSVKKKKKSSPKNDVRAYDDDGRRRDFKPSIYLPRIGNNKKKNVVRRVSISGVAEERRVITTYVRRSINIRARTIATPPTPRTPRFRTRYRRG